MSKIKAFIWWIVSALILGWLSNYFYENTKNIPILKYLFISLKWIYNFIIDFLNFKIKIFWLIIVSVVISIINKLYESSRNEQLPEFIKYEKDVFKSWIWRWKWEASNDGWNISKLTPYCPIDDIQLINNGGFMRVSYYCPKCQKEYNEFNNPVEYTEEIKVLINDKVNKDTYPRI